LKMSKKLVFWAIVIFIILAFLTSVSEILFPFIFGLFIAYFFDPLVCRLVRNGMNRTLASGIIVGTFTATLIAIVALGAPVLAKQGQALAENIPHYYAQFKNEIIPDLERQMYKISPELAHQAKIEASNQADFVNIQKRVTKFVAHLLNSGTWLFNLLSLIFVTPFVSFYILRDWGGFKAKVDELLPRQYADTIKEQINKIDRTVSAYLRGQLNVCLILGTYNAVALTIAGLNFGFLIGFGAGLLCFIPFVGVAIGGLIGITVALFQYGFDPEQVGIIAAIFVFGQFIEGNFIAPKIVGDKVGVHPAWIIFGMLAGGSLLGFTGVILAVPLTAIINVLIQFAIEEYEKSEYYNGAKVRVNISDNLIYSDPSRAEAFTQEPPETIVMGPEKKYSDSRTGKKAKAAKAAKKKTIKKRVKAK